MQENINIPDSTITTNLSFRQLVLMNMQQLTNFPYIEKDFDALTDYELLCLVVKFLNDVIDNQNEQNASITRMYQSFLALQDYVNNTKDELEDAFNNLDNYVRNYFDNLDVQEEIDNKLDEMLEDGVLEQIIEQFLQLTSLICFDRVSDMRESVNLTNGSYAKTLGYYLKNDGGSALYKIRKITNDDIIDNQYIIEINDSSNELIAELIINSPIDVRCLGIKGDGTTTSNELANGLKKHNSFIFKDGNYVIPQLTLENLNKYELDGINATLTGTSSFVFNTCSNIKIKNLNFDSNTNKIFQFSDCENVIVEKNNFTNNEVINIQMIRTHGNTCKNFKFLNNNFISVSKINTWGGALYIDGQGKNGSSDLSTETLPIEQIEVRGNLFEDIGTGGVNFGGAKDVIIDSNIFKNSYGTQNMLSTFTRESTNLVITNNTYSGCGWECCILNYCNKATISNNYAEDFGYGFSIENASSNINISSNTLNGMKNSRTHTGSGMQANTYGIIAKDSTQINIDSNNITDCTNNIYLGTSLSYINVNSNILSYANNGIAYGGSNGNHDNILYSANSINNCSNGITAGSHGKITIINNNINTSSYGIGLDQFSTDTNILIDGNYINSAIGINEASVYNIDCHQTITNNKIIADNIFSKTSWGTNIGFITWFNPDVTLNETHLSTKFVKGSVIKYNHTDFTTKPNESAAAGIGYFMGNVENGVVFIMSDGVWKRKTGGGGSTNITTSDW